MARLCTTDAGDVTGVALVGFGALLWATWAEGVDAAGVVPGEAGFAGTAFAVTAFRGNALLLAACAGAACAGAACAGAGCAGAAARLAAGLAGLAMT